MGAEALFAHVPEWRHPLCRLTTAALAVAALALGAAALYVVDSLWPAWTMAGQMALLLMGFAWAGQFFWRRAAYRSAWGEKAYRLAFTRHIAPGLPLLFVAIAHSAYAPGPRVWPAGAAPIGGGAAVYFFTVGLVLWARGGRAVGADNGLMLYVYFPGESRMVNTPIYAILRHPMYAGLVRMGLAAGLWGGTAFSIAFGLFLPLGLWLFWLSGVEEPELMERFGAGYANYRKRVPAFWPRLADLGQFWRFVITGQ